MLTIAIALFVAAAAGGLFLASRIMAGRTPPLAVALVHGAAAAAGLVCLTMAVLSSDAFGGPGYALVVLALAALGGFVLLSFHLRGKPWPKPIVLAHGFIAVVGLTILVIAVSSLR